jgi:hypothetical protein
MSECSNGIEMTCIVVDEDTNYLPAGDEIPEALSYHVLTATTRRMHHLVGLQLHACVNYFINACMH